VRNISTTVDMEERRNNPGVFSSVSSVVKSLERVTS